MNQELASGIGYSDNKGILISGRTALHLSGVKEVEGFMAKLVSWKINETESKLKQFKKRAEAEERQRKEEGWETLKKPSQQGVENKKAMKQIAAVLNTQTPQMQSALEHPDSGGDDRQRRELVRRSSRRADQRHLRLGDVFQSRN